MEPAITKVVSRFFRKTKSADGNRLRDIYLPNLSALFLRLLAKVKRGEFSDDPGREMQTRLISGHEMSEAFFKKDQIERIKLAEC